MIVHGRYPSISFTFMIVEHVRDIEAAESKQSECHEILGTAHTLKAIRTLDPERNRARFWKTIGMPMPREREWRCLSVDVTVPDVSKKELREFCTIRDSIDRLAHDVKFT